MPADNSAELDQLLQDSLDNATRLEGLVPSMLEILNGFGARLEAALKADNTIDSENTARAIATVRTVLAKDKASVQQIADAVVANTPNAT